MFGLVKASRLRQAEEDLSVASNERKEWRETADVWRGRSTNWRAVAESRLVAVLLLRDRLIAAKSSVQEIAKALTETAMAVADKAQERDNALQENARLHQCWTTNVVVAEQRTAERDAAQAVVRDLGLQLAKAKLALVAIEHILEAEQPPIETAIIRPSSTNRLRWRVNDDDGKALGQGSTGYATVEEATTAFRRAAYLISLDHRAPEDDRIGRIREVLTREPDDPGNTTMALAT